MLPPFVCQLMFFGKPVLDLTSSAKCPRLEFLNERRFDLGLLIFGDLQLEKPTRFICSQIEAKHSLTIRELRLPGLRLKFALQIIVDEQGVTTGILRGSGREDELVLAAKPDDMKSKLRLWVGGIGEGQKFFPIALAVAIEVLILAGLGLAL